MALNSMFSSDSNGYGSPTTAPELDWETFQQYLAPSLYSGDPRGMNAGRGQWANDLGWDMGGVGTVGIAGLDRDAFFLEGVDTFNGYGDNAGYNPNADAAYRDPVKQAEWNAKVDAALKDPNTIYQLYGDSVSGVDRGRTGAQYRVENGKMIPIGQFDKVKTSAMEDFMDYGLKGLGLPGILIGGHLAGMWGGAGGAASGGVGSAAGSGLVPGTGGSGLAAGTGGTGLSTAGSSIGAGIGSSIPSAPLLGTGAGAGAVGGYGLASGAGSSSLIPSAAAASPYSLAGAGASLTPAAAGATSPYSLAGAGASLTPASSGGGFQSFMDNVLGGAKSIKGLMSSPAGRIGSGLLQMYNSSEANDQYKKLRDMYGPNSPYAQQLRKQLERKDAAAGRRSQYGPREVELQARLADMYSRGYPSMNAAMNQRNQMRGQGMGLIFSGLDKSGVLEDAWKGLGGLFGG